MDAVCCFTYLLPNVWIQCTYICLVHNMNKSICGSTPRDIVSVVTPRGTRPILPLFILRIWGAFHWRYLQNKGPDFVQFFFRRRLLTTLNIHFNSQWNLSYPSALDEIREIDIYLSLLVLVLEGFCNLRWSLY